MATNHGNKSRNTTSLSGNNLTVVRSPSLLTNNKLFIMFSNSLFQGRALDPTAFHNASIQFTQILNENGLDYIIWLFFETLLKKGTIIYRQKILDSNSNCKNIIDHLSSLWRSYYSFVIPTLSYFLQTLGHQILTNFNETALVRFRDSVVLHSKINFEDYKSKQIEINSNFKQMLLVIVKVHEPPFPTASYLKFENIVSIFISPFIGYQIFSDCNNQKIVDDDNLNASHSPLLGNSDQAINKKDQTKNIRSNVVDFDIRPRSALIFQKNEQL